MADKKIAGFFGQSAFVDREEAADVDQAVLLSGHRASVRAAADLPHDFRHRPIGPAGLSRLDEPRVFDASRRIKEDRNAMFVTQCAGRLDVLHAAGLAARHVDVCFQ